MNPIPVFTTPGARAPHTIRLDARAVVDAHGVQAAPGSLLLRVGAAGCEVLAAGAPGLVDQHPGSVGAPQIDLPDSVLTPGHVNAHTHLDLTHIGPRGYDPADGFDSWLAMILRERLHEEGAIRESVRLGVALSIAGGVVAVGDIAGVGRVEAALELRASPLLGVSYVELFGVGDRQATVLRDAAAMLDRVGVGDANRVRIGLSPHAPFTAGSRLYAGVCELSARTGAPLCTHLAESVEERRFIEQGDGPIRALLERFDVWSDAILDDVGAGAHPVAHLEPSLRAAHWLLAHVNDCPDGALPMLASTAADVVVCPRGWAYFGRGETVGRHRWRDMLDAGVNVALGTDSVVNLPREGPARIATLDEARCLRERDGADARTLLRMITTNGARALGLQPSLFMFDPGPIAGVVRVAVGDSSDSDPLAMLMDTGTEIETLALGSLVGERLRGALEG